MDPMRWDRPHPRGMRWRVEEIKRYDKNEQEQGKEDGRTVEFMKNKKKTKKQKLTRNNNKTNKKIKKIPQTGIMLQGALS